MTPRTTIWTLWGLLLAMLAPLAAAAQPVASSQQLVRGRLIFRDLREKNTWYYGPGKLSLTVDRAGKPVFQLISIRYTGTALSGDQAAKRFTNLLQFSVSMEPLNAAALAAIRQELKLPAAAALVPLPVRRLEAVLVSGLGNGLGAAPPLKKRLDGQGGGEGAAGRGAFWTERPYTVPLDNHEAQILWDQQLKGRIAVSLNYAFYADIARPREEEVVVSGDSVLVRRFDEQLAPMPRDTEVLALPVFSDVLNIAVDAGQYPDLLRRIDVNENSIPPAYAALEVKCFDFADNLRPELALKIVEIEGAGVGGQPVAIKTRFNSRQPDVTTHFVSFPYAVRMDQPLRYRVREVPYEGEPYQSPWQTVERGGNLIDVTTRAAANPVDHFCVEVEVLPEAFASRDARRVTVHFVYAFGGQPYAQTLDFAREEESAFLRERCISYDKDHGLKYFVTYTLADGRQRRGFVHDMPADQYILVK